MNKGTDASHQVDEFIENALEDFQPICRRLREIFLSEGLTEEIKWGGPCYSHQGLVCSIGAFKKHAGTWFFKGALLDDPNEVLRKAQKETKGLRSLIFTSVKEIDEKQIRSFVRQAIILNEKQIAVPGVWKKKESTIPPILQEALDKDPELRLRFEEFSLSKKREFTEWIDEAKREKTKMSRLEKSIEMISKGIGRHDKYRK